MSLYEVIGQLYVQNLQLQGQLSTTMEALAAAQKGAEEVPLPENVIPLRPKAPKES